MQVAMQTGVKTTEPPPELAAEGGLRLQRCLARSRHESHAGMCLAHCIGAWHSSGLTVVQQQAMTL